jgi:hypothetical protein
VTSAIAELGLAPEVIPLATLADLLGVPVALLLDEVVQGMLAVVMPWSIGRFESAPFPQESIALPDGAVAQWFPKVELFDLYPGETPAFYVTLATFKGGSDGLYRLLAGGRVEVIAGIHRSEQGAAMDWLREPCEIGLADLLVHWSEIVRRGWAPKLLPESREVIVSGAADPTGDERTARRNRGWVRRARKILERTPTLIHSTGPRQGRPRWRPLSQAVLEELKPTDRPHVTTIEKALRAHWDD